MANINMQGDQQKKEAKTEAKAILTALTAAYDATLAKWKALTNPQKNALLNTISNWDAAAPAPTVARENALFAWCTLLTIALIYLIRWQNVVNKTPQN